MNDNAFLAIFPFFFAGMWLLATTALWWFSGWRALQDRYPDKNETPLDRLRFRSGAMGRGSIWNPWGNVNFGNCLRLDVCPSGLRVGIWRIFGPFSKPFMVPWGRITVERKRYLFMPIYRLGFGDDNLSSLIIWPPTFARLANSGLLPKS